MCFITFDSPLPNETSLDTKPHSLRIIFSDVSPPPLHECFRVCSEEYSSSTLLPLKIMGVTSPLLTSHIGRIGPMLIVINYGMNNKINETNI